MNFEHTSYVAIVTIKWHRSSIAEKINSVLPCSNDKCGITINHYRHVARDIYIYCLQR
jgi:hypothetical protein